MVEPTLKKEREKRNGILFISEFNPEAVYGFILCSDMSGTSRVEKIELLDATMDAYGGVTVDLKEAMDSEAFAYMLRASMAQWMHKVFLFLILFCCFFYRLNDNILMHVARK